MVGQLEAEVMNPDSESPEVPVEELIYQLRTEKYCRMLHRSRSVPSFIHPEHGIRLPG